ncbi:formimidoyltetrahydrofolate cyclodeaminase [Halococcus morrhuae DSM 1307]|uniref:Formimidoyltetrahydrofolate cyclodeaminase n=1 Tax=Halococcus morrhuae DSM 1307 TaxID=931277 RepID=M0MER4_HALMO|nr:cyclodeaminase/cyclohydrolase family protein [Halococcus morrhuae]EMA42900.1 formimidoyltetrahydrofolate cyclodeaminase [Halococcus morrhuae DSM 1307]
MAFAEQTIAEFLDDVAARAVTPSGGAVAAVGGAFGAALCEMVCIHTIEKDDGDVGAGLSTVRTELETRRAHLLELADEDSTAVDELQAAFAASTDEGRAELIDERSRRAADVPLDIAEACLDVLDHAKAVTAKGNRNALADAGTGAFLAHAALKAAVFTVRANLELIEEPAVGEEIEGRVAEIDGRGDEALAQVRANIEDAI